MPKSDVFKPQAIIEGKYKILRILGEGAFGQVYEATELRLDRRVALKTLFVDRAIPNMVQRFEREVELIKQIEHGNVVRLYDYGRTESGQLYMSMEYVAGRELRDVLDEEGALGVSRATNIAMQVLDALAEAQTHDVVHRDLKPENILLTEKGVHRDVVKLLDFGIAKTVDPTAEGGSVNLTGTGVSCGTPLYMAPEQFEARDVGPHTDIYAVGLILLEMITGKCPIEGDSLFQIVAQHVQKGVEVPARLKGSAVGPILERALQREWVHRYRSAAEMHADLSSAGIPGHSNPPAELRDTSQPGQAKPSTSEQAQVRKKRARPKVDAGSGKRGEPLGSEAFGATVLDDGDVGEPSPEVSGFFDGMLATGEGAVKTKHATEETETAEEDDGDWWKNAVSTAIDGESGVTEAARAMAAERKSSGPVAAKRIQAKPERTRAAAGRRRNEAAATPEPADTGTESGTAAKRSNRVLWGVLAVLLLAVAGTGAYLFTKQAKTTSTKGDMTASGGQQTAPPPEDAARALATRLASDPLPASVVAWVAHIGPKPVVYAYEIIAEPQRATVLLDGRRVCDDTPCTVMYNAANSGKLEVTRTGYATGTRNLSLYRGPLAEPLVITLEKL